MAEQARTSVVLLLLGDPQNPTWVVVDVVNGQAFPKIPPLGAMLDAEHLDDLLLYQEDPNAEEQVLQFDLRLRFQPMLTPDRSSQIVTPGAAPVVGIGRPPGS